MLNQETTSVRYLLSELQKGQVSAFDFIFRKYYKALCALANAYINDLDKAQSIVQDSFVKLWLEKHRANEIKNLSSYLSVMVHNQCIDYLRRLKVQDKIEKKVQAETTNYNVEELILTHEFEDKLITALSSLPERSRIAFEYSRFEDLTYKEIATKMEISVKAVEALVSRALKILRKEMKEYLPIIILLIKITRL